MPLRVEDVPAGTMPEVLRPLIFCDLFGLDAPQARRVLLEAVKGPSRPDGEQGSPAADARGLQRLGGAGPRLPQHAASVIFLPATLPSLAGTGSW